MIVKVIRTDSTLLGKPKTLLRLENDLEKGEKHFKEGFKGMHSGKNGVITLINGQGNIVGRCYVV